MQINDKSSDKSWHTAYIIFLFGLKGYRYCYSQYWTCIYLISDQYQNQNRTSQHKFFLSLAEGGKIYLKIQFSYVFRHEIYAKTAHYIQFFKKSIWDYSGFLASFALACCLCTQMRYWAPPFFTRRHELLVHGLYQELKL